MSLINEPSEETAKSLTISVAPSILIPWGAEALAKVEKNIKGLKLNITVLHSMLSLEALETGSAQVAIVHGPVKSSPSLMALPLYEQKLCIVPANLKENQVRRANKIDVISIESHTDAGKIIKKQLQANSGDLPFEVKISQFAQSFSAIAQLARAGFGNGIVPIELARTLGISDKKLISLGENIALPVFFVVRKNSYKLSAVEALYERLRDVDK